MKSKRIKKEEKISIVRKGKGLQVENKARKKAKRSGRRIGGKKVEENVGRGGRENKQERR